MGWHDSLSPGVNYSGFPKNEGFSGAGISVLNSRKFCENRDTWSLYDSVLLWGRPRFREGERDGSEDNQFSVTHREL